MSANIDSHSQRRRAWSSRTTDLDPSTSDLNEEHTPDLKGVATADVTPADDRSHSGTAARVAADQEPPAARAREAHTQDLHAPAERDESQRSQANSIANREERHDTIASSPEPELAVPSREHPKESARALRPGTVLGDRYVLEHSLGAGGTALVFRARDLQASDKNARDAHVAIKIPRPEAKDRERAVARLKHEYKHAHRLSHPNIVRVLDLNVDGQTWFMTMELIQGKSLAALLRDWPALPEERKRTILASCADALAYAHSQDIVHGDFKPTNVLVRPSGEVSVFDFGAAAATEGEDTRIPAGTPAYASPQVLSGLHPDRRDDVFSFACVAYELLTGQHPFERRSSIEAREIGGLPARAWNLAASEWLALLSALSWDREQRPSDIGTLMKALLPEITTQPVDARAEEEAPPAAEPAFEAPEELVPAQRSWGFFVFVAVALGVLVLATQHQGNETVAEQREPPRPASAHPEQTTVLGKPVQSSFAPGVASSGLISSYPESAATSEGPSTQSSVTRPDERSADPVRSATAPTRPLSTVSFGTSSIVTSESAIAAVFIVQRSEPYTGRVTARWKTESGTAAAGEDFVANDNGVVEFADGQKQRAIYIPLRNDAQKENDETFTVRLTGARGGQVGEIASVEATIKDDD